MNKLEGGAGVRQQENGGVQTRLPEKKLKSETEKKLKKLKKKNLKKNREKEKRDTGTVLAICRDIPERAYFAL